MNKKPIFSLLIFIGLFLYACNSNEVNNSSDNYWERSDLAKTDLKGKVKTFSIRGMVTSYNESGFITSIAYNSVESSSSSIYTYNTNGQLDKIVTTSPNGTSQLITTMTFEYKNPGKYIVESNSSLNLYSLTPNLSSMTTVSSISKDNYYKIEYIFKNATTMYIINTYATNSIISKYSSTIQYNGNYPSGWSNQTDFTKDIIYASNGMLKSYTYGSTGPGTYYSEVHTFNTNNNYLKPESTQKSFTDTANPSNSFSNSVTYTYNDKNEMIEISDDGNVTQYINFIYDSQGNWTSRTMKYKFKGATTMTTNAPETRIFTYW